MEEKKIDPDPNKAEKNMAKIFMLQKEAKNRMKLPKGKRDEAMAKWTEANAF
jgi:hypothetical protein